MAEHSTLTTSQVHEPKHITSSATGDAGKVITPSSTVAGTSVLRNLTDTEISSKKSYLAATIADVSTASSIYIPAPFAGTITKIYTALQGAIAGADSIISTTINGVAVTGGNITVAFTGSAAGDIDSSTPSAANTFTEGQVIRVITDGGSTNAVALTVTLVCTRTG